VRLAVPVALVALLAGCTSGTAKPAAHASPSASAMHARPSERSLVLAVNRRDQDQVLLYRVDSEHAAHLVGEIQPPSGYGPHYGYTLAGGDQPDVCVLWGLSPPVSDAGGAEAAYCYPGGAKEGRPVVTDASLGDIALNAAGDRLFWSTVGEGEESLEGVVADYASGRATGSRSFDLDCNRYLISAVWASPERLVLHCTSGANDDPGFLTTEELGSGSWAPRPGKHIGADETLVRPGSADETSVLVLERHCESGCDTAMPRMRAPRAVRVDLQTGRILEVIATPAKGRYVDAVTGGPHGVVYVTGAQRQGPDLRVYLRWPGEEHGSPIIGLPADVETVVAQP
jgi:hypothetical protein